MTSLEPAAVTTSQQEKSLLPAGLRDVLPPEADHAADRAVEDLAYASGKEGGGEAVDGVALGAGGAALGEGDVLAGLFEGEKILDA